jgi:hypothetical protein
LIGYLIWPAESRTILLPTVLKQLRQLMKILLPEELSRSVSIFFHMIDRLETTLRNESTSKEQRWLMEMLPDIIQVRRADHPHSTPHKT